jgi:predicted transcriptional regulator
MEIIWQNEPVSAKQMSVYAEKSVGWNKNTTYTVIKKLIEKNVILRTEPNFTCTSLVKKEDVRKAETNTLISKLFNGSKKTFFSALLEDDALTEEELDELRQMIEKR